MLNVKRQDHACRLLGPLHHRDMQSYSTTMKSIRQFWRCLFCDHTLVIVTFWEYNKKLADKIPEALPQYKAKGYIWLITVCKLGKLSTHISGQYRAEKTQVDV